MNNYNDYKTIKLKKIDEYVINVQLNRPNKYNAISPSMWKEIGHVFDQLSYDPNVRAVVLSANGKAFSSGIDFYENSSLFMPQNDDKSKDTARNARELYRYIREWQNAFMMIENCPKPVIAAIHGLCIGAGFDLVAAADIRLAAKNTTFAVKEVDVAIASDIGALNRLPKICANDSWIREICLTARNFDENEALKQNILSNIYNTEEEMMTEAIKLATLIASKSPVGVEGTKINLNYSRDHSVNESMNYIATWNMSQLMTEDIPKSAIAIMSKDKTPKYSKL